MSEESCRKKCKKKLYQDLAECQEKFKSGGARESCCEAAVNDYEECKRDCRPLWKKIIDFIPSLFSSASKTEDAIKILKKTYALASADMDAEEKKELENIIAVLEQTDRK